MASDSVVDCKHNAWISRDSRPAFMVASCVSNLSIIVVKHITYPWILTDGCSGVAVTLTEILSFRRLVE